MDLDLMPGMPMGSDAGGGGGGGASSKCAQTSVMLWNWHTQNICLISSQWHIRTPAMFAGSCLAVAVFAMSLALLRRSAKEYDAWIKRAHQRRMVPASMASVSRESSNSTTSPLVAGASNESEKTGVRGLTKRLSTTAGPNSQRFRPSPLQQLLRGFLQLSQFVVAYFTMLIFMLLNGYLIFSILGGIFLGYVLFEWESVECEPLKETPEYGDA